MSDALDLIEAVVGGASAQYIDSGKILELALEREVDPLRYCAASLRLGQSVVMERAAAWAGFAYYHRIPRDLTGQTQTVRLEELANARAVCMRLLDRDVYFSAPSFVEILALRTRLLERPDLHERLCFIPERALRDYLVQASSVALIDGSRQALARVWPFATAQLELTRLARTGFVIGLVLLFILVLLVPFIGLYWLLPLTLFVLAAPALLRLAAAWRSFWRPPPQPPPARPDDADLPVYSVLIPLRDEAHMVPQLYRAMWALDYPAEKLDIKFVIEDRSQATLAAANQWLDDPRFSVLAVPDALPRTKPKALDFALPLCRGEFVVVFDAEDLPDRDQLWLAALAFRDAPDVHCLQAELFVDNGDETWLTSLFAGEYAGLFGILLPALAAWRLPLPLGGTSNHFRITALRQLGGWDAFNVTEDADLGIRLARRRLRTEMLASRTQEEAPVRLACWMAQRTRWMKGWMQTFIVHNRDPGQLIREMGWFAALVFEMTVLSMIASPLLHSALALMLLAQALLGLTLFPPLELSWTGLHLGVLLLGYGATLALTLLGLHRQRRHGLFALQAVLPVYWLLIGVATIRALHELIDRPFYWAKTEHRAKADVEGAEVTLALPLPAPLPHGVIPAKAGTSVYRA